MTTICRTFTEAIMKEVARKPCGRTDKTRRRYELILKRGLAALMASGQLVKPGDIEPKKHGILLLAPFERGRGINGLPIYGQFETGIWDRFLKRYNIDLVDDMGLSWSSDNNYQRQYYTEETMDGIFAAVEMNPELSMLVALAYYQCMRRCDMRALYEMTDPTLPGKPLGVDTGRMLLSWRGKGRGGGKVRCLEMVDILPGLIDRYREWRLERLGRARSYNPDATMPDRFLIVQKHGRLSALCQNSMDLRAQSIERLCQDNGLKVHIEWHSFRASGATAMSSHGIPDECIQKVLGHSDVKTTRLYILRHLRETRDTMKEWSGIIAERQEAQNRAKAEPELPTVTV